MISIKNEKKDLLNLFFTNKTKKINKIKDYKKSELIGFSVDIKGRLKNSDRSKSMIITKGKVKKNSLNIFTHSSKHAINTKTGI